MKNTKLKKMKLTTMWAAMYSWAAINHLSWLAKAGSCLQVVGKRRQTVMLMVRKQEETGIIGIIGTGPGRFSMKTQTTHCRLLKSNTEDCFGLLRIIWESIFDTILTKQVLGLRCRQ